MPARSCTRRTRCPTARRPRVRMNFVASADGAATLDGRSGPLGGESDRDLMQVLRAMADVVLVGAGTVRAEGYGGVRSPKRTARGAAEAGLSPQPRARGRQPRRCASSRGIRSSPGSRALRRGHLRVRPAARCARRSSRSPTSSCAATEPEADLAAMLAAFAARGWTQILCEGGPHLFGALLDADLVDEVCLTLAPRFVGGAAGRIARAVRRSSDALLARSRTRSRYDEGFVFLRYLAPEADALIRRRSRRHPGSCSCSPARRGTAGGSARSPGRRCRAR